MKMATAPTHFSKATNMKHKSVVGSTVTNPKSKIANWSISAARCRESYGALLLADVDGK